MASVTVAVVESEGPGTVLIDGGSTVVSPPGGMPAGPLRGTEGVLVAELDLDDLGRSELGLDAAGHCAGPDDFALSVDRPARPRVRPAA